MSLLLKRRFSSRNFTGESISNEQLQALLEAARWAPSCFNEQPWRFIVVSRDDAASFHQAVSCLSEGNRDFVRKAAVLMFTLAVPAFEKNKKPNLHAWHDVGLAVMCLTVQALEAGLQCHEMAGIDRDAIRETFDAPNHLDIVSGLAIGKSAGPPPPDRSRRALNDLIWTRKPAPRPTESEAIIAAERYGDVPGATPVPLPVDVATQTDPEKN